MFYSTALGRAIVAHLKPELATALVERATLRSRTAKTVASRGALRKVLEDARVGGVAFDLEENDDGVVCIGTPLFLDGRVVAAISVSVPSTRYTSALGEEIRQSLTALDRQFRTMRGSPLRHAPST
jgi:DNA-binding IclR family transcriptional regulator